MQKVAIIVTLCMAMSSWGQTLKERELIKQGVADQPMRVLLTTDASDYSILRSQTFNVDPTDQDIVLLSKRMFATVTDEKSLGVGIAAPQVGVLARVLWVKRFDKHEKPFECYYNLSWKPVSSIYQLGPEGCLSIPDQRGQVYRHQAIEITYQDAQAKQHVEVVSGFTAVIFQHEGDHLIGQLFTDLV